MSLFLALVLAAAAPAAAPATAPAAAPATAPIGACPDADPPPTAVPDAGAQPGWSERLAGLRFVVKPEAFPFGVFHGRWAWLSLPAAERARPPARGEELGRTSLALLGRSSLALLDRSSLALLDLGTGRLVWNRAGAGRPLFAGPDFVLALAPVASDEVRVVALSTAGARLFASKTLPLPRAPAAIGLAQVESAALVLQWSARRTCADGRALELSGTLRVDLWTGDAQVTALREGGQALAEPTAPVEARAGDRTFRGELKGEGAQVCAVRTALPDHRACPAEKAAGCDLPAGPPGCALWKTALPSAR